MGNKTSRIKGLNITSHSTVTVTRPDGSHRTSRYEKEVMKGIVVKDETRVDRRSPAGQNEISVYGFSFVDTENGNSAKKILRQDHMSTEK